MMIADTDVLIDYLRGHGWADRVAIELSTSSFATTAVTAFELRSGAHSSRQRQAVESLLAAMTVLSFSVADAERAATIRQELEAQGRGIGMADYTIAAICLTHDGVLLTRNRKHFERVNGLRLSMGATL